MKIFINGNEKSIPEPLTIFESLSNLDIVIKDGMALAVNNKVVPKSKWDEFKLNENDKILIISAAQGG